MFQNKVYAMTYIWGITDEYSRMLINILFLLTCSQILKVLLANVCSKKAFRSKQPIDKAKVFVARYHIARNLFSKLLLFFSSICKCKYSLLLCQEHFLLRYNAVPKNFFRREGIFFWGGGGDWQKDLKNTDQIFVYVYFCYVFTRGTFVWWGGY